MPQSAHAPLHGLDEAGTFIVTASTYHHHPYFEPPDLRTLLRDELLGTADLYGWCLVAWAVMPDHYHFVGACKARPVNLPAFIGRLHSLTARAVNERDGCPERRVWSQYWDTRITSQRSYLARLAYVNRNPVKHGLVEVASEYPWCSAAWFRDNAPPSLFRVVSQFKVDRVSVREPGPTN